MTDGAKVKKKIGKKIFRRTFAISEISNKVQILISNASFYLKFLQS